jgi:hypothetical protein
MGLLSLEYNKNDFPSFARIAAALPTMSNQILGFVGNQSKTILKNEILAGQLLKYRPGGDNDAAWRYEKGRPKASYGIKYAQYVTIRSYPANFFTVSNSRQKKRAIWTDLKSKTNSKLDFILREFDKKYLQAEFEKYTDSPRSRQRF